MPYMRITQDTKKKLFAEVQALRDAGYVITTKITAGDLVIHVATEKNPEAIIFIDDNGSIKPLTYLSENEIATFMQSFPKASAPLLAAALHDSPPTPKNANCLVLRSFNCR